MEKIFQYKIGGAGCGACILKIQNLIQPIAGVETVKFDLKTGTLTVTGQHAQQAVVKAMEAGKFSAEALPESATV